MFFDDDFAFFYFFGINLFLEYNPILSVLSLIMIYINSTLVLSSLNYEYVSAVLLLIYVGAISILILFIIMMYQVNETEMDLLYNRLYITNYIYLFTTIYVIHVIIDSFLMNTYQHLQNVYYTVNYYIGEYLYNILEESIIGYTDTYSNINNLSDILYTYYMYPLTIAALFLFFIVIVCINLILRHIQ